MITEDYVSFEIAKLLEEKGFDEKISSYYEDNTLCLGEWFEWNRSPFGEIAAPSHAMAMKWLRAHRHHEVCELIDDDHDVGKLDSGKFLFIYLLVILLDLLCLDA